jgi:prepilin-type N-terminal cleavage/methylation domain-containing protein
MISSTRCRAVEYLLESEAAARMARETQRMIYSAQMRTKERWTRYDGRKSMNNSSIICHPSYPGFTLTELIIVMVVMSAFVLIAQLNLLGLLEKSSFKAQIQQIVSTMQMAAGSAGQSDRRYEVIIDLEQQSYLLREITTPDLSVVLDQEIISQNNLGSNCRIIYVEFDDGQNTSSGQAKFRAGRAGWAYGGKILIQDEHENTYSIVVNRLNKMIELKEGEVELLEPKTRDEIIF